jgi:hypothetical protein
LAVLIVGCTSDSPISTSPPTPPPQAGPPPPPTPSTHVFDFDFSADCAGWVPGFADYPPGQDAFYHLVAGVRALPAPLDTTKKGLFISGDNHSDDLFMYFKHRVTGLQPNATYRVAFGVSIATNAPAGCAGAGGSPGENVWVKTGASAAEPVAAVDSEGSLRLNVDKGDQSAGGRNAVVVGDLASSQPCGEGNPRYELKQLTSGADSVEVAADSSGAARLLVGTDSGFEGTTSVYFTSLTSVFVPR